MFFSLRGRLRIICVAALIIAVVVVGILAIPHSPKAALQAKNAATTPVHLFNWSDPATWQGHVPSANAAVSIPAGRTVVLDTNPPPLKSLLIKGTLTCAEKNLALSANWIIVLKGGLFRCGSEQHPFMHALTITLTGNNPQEDVMKMGTKLLGTMGGGLELHGQNRVSWVHLGATAYAGSSQIILSQQVNWSKGDRITLASTGYDPRQAEELVIDTISGTTLTLTQPLKYTHWGQMQSFAGQTVDERAEVGLLSHNIVVQGDASSVANGFGGHSMFMSGSAVHIAGVEFYHMGQLDALGRYPVHWHLAGDETGDYIQNSSVDHSFNRCVTVHGTDGVLVRANVAFDTIGHCYFLEDGSETRNMFAYNLGVMTVTPPSGKNLLPSDTRPATFWITNPANSWIGNVAAGSAGEGFWFALPEHPLALDSNLTNIWPRQTPLGLFTNNTAHSIRDIGLFVDDGPNPDNSTQEEYYGPVKQPGVDSSSPVETAFQNFAAYKAGNLGVWMRGYHLSLKGAVLADNPDAAVFAGSDGMLEDSLVVGETANHSDPAPDQGTPLAGFSFYDGTFGVNNVTFVNFLSTSQRPAGALDYFENDRNPIHVENFVQNVHFVNANPVYLMQPSIHGGEFAVFLDTDGSLTGQAGQYVAANSPLLVDGGCSLKTTWNAYVCKHHFVSVSVTSDQSLTQVGITRDDGVSQTSNVYESFFSVSSLPNHAYTWSYPQAARTLQIDLTNAQAGNWVELVIPYSSAHCQLYRDAASSNHLPAAQSLGEFNASNGQKYFYDSTHGLLYIKLVPQNGHDWTRVNITPA